MPAIFDAPDLAILEMPGLRKRVARWSVEAYERLVEQGLAPKHGELIRGIIIEKMSKSPLHMDLSRWIYDEIHQCLRPGYVVRQEGPLRLADSEPEPDLSVVQGTRAELRTKHPEHALLVVEVAVTSVIEDREYAAMYAEANIPEYWIVLAEEKKVEVRRSPAAKEYQEIFTYGLGQTLRCVELPEISLSLDQMFS